MSCNHTSRSSTAMSSMLKPDFCRVSAEIGPRPASGRPDRKLAANRSGRAATEPKLLEIIVFGPLGTQLAAKRLGDQPESGVAERRTIGTPRLEPK